VVPSSTLVSVSLTLALVVILEADLVGHPFGGRRHQLHQPGSADVRAALLTKRLSWRIRPYTQASSSAWLRAAGRT
jgi:hypothetical protein